MMWWYGPMGGWGALFMTITTVLFWGLIILGAIALFRYLRSEEHTSELQSQFHLVCRLLLEKKNLVSDILHSQEQIDVSRVFKLWQRTALIRGATHHISPIVRGNRLTHV